IAFHRGQLEELSDFGFVQQQFAKSFGLMILDIAVRVFINVRIVQVDLAILDAGKGIADLAFAGPKRLYLRASQDNSRLESLKNMIVATGFGVRDNIRHSLAALVV